MRWPLIFLLMMPFSFGSAMAASGDRWSVAGDNVNLRRGPGTDHESKRQLRRGQDVVERGREGDWHHVEIPGVDGLLGWIHRSLLVSGSRDVKDNAATSSPADVAANIASAKSPDPVPEALVELRKAVMETNGVSEQSALGHVDPDAVLQEMRSYVRRRDNLPKDPVEPRATHSGREIISPVPIRKPGDQSRVPTELVLASSPEVAGVDIDAMEQFRDSVSYLNSRAWSVAGIKLFSEIEPVGGGVVQVKTTDDWFEVPKIGQTSYLNTLVDRWSSAKADGAPAGVMLVDPKGDLLMHQSKP